MTVTSSTGRVSYTGNGATTNFVVPFAFFSANDLVVMLDSVVKTLTTHYTVTGGNTVHFLTAPANGVVVLIYRDPPLTQAIDYSDNDPFPASATEEALDRGVMIDQRTRELIAQLQAATSISLGIITGGTVTIVCAGRPMQFLTNNGAFTLAAPIADGSCTLLVTNGASAGIIAFSGFSIGSDAGDPLDTVPGNKWTLSIWRINGVAGYHVIAHQVESFSFLITEGDHLLAENSNELVTE